MKMYTAEQLNNSTKEELIAAVLQAQNDYSVLLERLMTLNVNTFGRKSEKMEYEGQESIFNEAEAEVEAAQAAIEEPEMEEVAGFKRKKRAGKRDEDLSKFEKKEIPHELSDEHLTAIFGENGWKRLPDQVYNKLEVHPAKFEVYEHHVAVYASKSGDRIVKAPHPAELLNNSIATPSLVAAVMNAKYTNAMPLYRVEQEFERTGVSISRQVMSNWMILCAERYLSLLYDLLHKGLIREPVLQADETKVQVSKNGEPTRKDCYMWLFRTGEFNVERPVILFDYQNSRAGEHAYNFLKGFSGALECDGYSGYRFLARFSENILIACCWAHARRKFADAVKAYGKNPGLQDTLAYKALGQISKIYHLDEKFKDLLPDERKKRRQSTVKPRVDAFFAWVKEHQGEVLPKSKTGEGFSYCLNNEKYLREFLDNGLIPIDNSASERAIRPFTVGRKNWQLIDTINGAKASAIIYSIVETAKANQLKPYEYLKHLLTEIPKRMDQKNSELCLDDLLPWSESLPDECKLKKSK